MEPAPAPAATVAIGEVMGALSRIKADCNEADFLVALRTLVTLVNNAFTQPDNPKLRRIRTGNKAFVARLGSKDGGVDALIAFGFVQGLDAKQEPMLQLKRTEPAFVDSAMAVLAHLRAILPPSGAKAPASKTAASTGGAASGPFAAPVGSTGEGGAPAGPPGATTTFAGVSDLGAQLQSTGGLGDMMGEMQQAMAANPEAAQEVAALSRSLAEGAAADPELLNNPMRAVEQLRQDPSAAEAFLNNPVCPNNHTCSIPALLWSL
jgi:type 1 fimbria pilin